LGCFHHALSFALNLASRLLTHMLIDRNTVLHKVVCGRKEKCYRRLAPNDAAPIDNATRRREHPIQGPPTIGDRCRKQFRQPKEHDPRGERLAVSATCGKETFDECSKPRPACRSRLES
jgi:hypothetical protein